MRWARGCWLARRLRKLGETLRLGFWLDSKLPPFVTAIAFAVLARGPAGASIPGDLLTLVVVFLLLFSSGHLANDLCDLEVDAAAGKPRPIARWNRTVAVATIAGLALAAIGLVGWRFDGPTVGVTVLAAATGLGYSVPPLRFKERGIWGWLSSATAQRSLTPAIGFQALGAWDAAAWALCGLGLLTGLRYIIVHQLEDRAADQAAGVRTVATAVDPRVLERLLARWLFPAEVLLAALAAALMSRLVPAVGVLTALFALYRLAGHTRGRPIRPASYVELHGLFNLVWPVTLIGTLMARRV